MAAPLIESDRRLYARRRTDQLPDRARGEQCVKVGDLRVRERPTVAQRFDRATVFYARRAR